MFKKFVLILLLFCTVLSAFAAVSMRTTWKNGRKYLHLNDVAKYYGMSVTLSGKSCILTSKYSRIVFDTARRAGSYNGTKITWSEPILLYKGNRFLSETDFQYILEPLIHSKKIPRKRVQTIMIDAGHGGKDKGAPGANGHWEKEANLQIALKLRKELINLGYSVILTRSGDSFPSLEDRVKIFNKCKRKPDLFISIHCNASKDRSVSGMETFAMTPQGAASSSDTKPSQQKFPGNAYNLHNIRLAYEIQRAMLRAGTGIPDRGVKQARFYVIKNVSCPAVLIEAGFVSNRSDCSKLFSPATQAKLVQAIIRGIQNYSAAVK